MEKTLVMVVASKDFRDEEYSEPKTLLQEKGAIIKTSSSAPEEAKGSSGTRAQVDISLVEINPEDFDGIIFVGGQGVTEYFADGDLMNLIRKFNEKNKLVAAICWAPEILANAGILKGRKATIWPGAKEALVSAGAIQSEENVVIDGNIVTASGPAYAGKFGQAIAEKLEL